MSKSIVTIIIVIGVGLPLLIAGNFFYGLYINNVKNSQLHANGKPAEGTIISIQQTGTYVNEQPEVLFRIRVEPDDEPAFESSFKKIISLLEIPNIQPGQRVNVKYDPNDYSSVVIEETSGAVQNKEQLEKMLIENQEINEKLNSTGIAADAIVTKFVDLNILINGDNKAVTLEVKVMPENDKPFDSIAHGVFMPSGLAKYQPGKEIHVKFDPNNKSVVAIDISKTVIKTTE